MMRELSLVSPTRSRSLPVVVRVARCRACRVVQWCGCVWVCPPAIATTGPPATFLDRANFSCDRVQNHSVHRCVHGAPCMLSEKILKSSPCNSGQNTRARKHASRTPQPCVFPARTLSVATNSPRHTRHPSAIFLGHFSMVWSNLLS
jgi:hypothetical protein